MTSQTYYMYKQFLTSINNSKQEAQLSQRDHVTIRVIEYSAK